MILTPLALADVPAALRAFSGGLSDTPFANQVFQRIAATLRFVDGIDISLSQDEQHRQAAIALLRRFGLGVRERAPADGLTWDGRAVSVAMEPSVIVHEVAHYQISAPARRHLPDFGMGAGPETGRRDVAEASRRLNGVVCDLEEALVSLLGILWEAELEQPAVLAFLEQNWLETGTSPHNRAHFLKIVNHLRTHGFLDETSRPTMTLRAMADDLFYAPLVPGELLNVLRDQLADGGQVSRECSAAGRG